MKKIFLLAIVLSSALFVFAQQNVQDVVYLKNGSVIRGIVLEQIPNESLKIQTSDGSIFVYEMADVEKITREKATAIQPEAAQQKRKGFIGGTFGLSMPVGSFASNNLTDGGEATVGYQLNLATFGYLFIDNIGITATLIGGGNPISSNSNIDAMWSYAGLMAGPLFSFPLSEKVEWDLRPMIGFASAQLTEISSTYDESISSDMAFGLNLGTQFRFNVGKRMALLLSADYFYTNPKFTFSIYNNGYPRTVTGSRSISTISLTFGVAYRLK